MCWQTEYLNQRGEGREGCGIHKWPKKPKLAHITDYLLADLSADAQARIDIRKPRKPFLKARNKLFPKSDA